jgi:hypothetical protein
MAATKKPNDAFDFAKKVLGNVTLERVQYEILDQAIKMIWTGAPWRWSIGSLPVIQLQPSISDYSIDPLPSDFLYLHRAYMTTGKDAPRELRIVSSLPTNVVLYGLPSELSHEIISGSNYVRVMPLPGSIGDSYRLVMQYKKQAPTISIANANTAGALVIDDEWFWVYQSAVLYLAFVYTNDERAGTAQVDVATGRAAFTGQRAIFEANLAMMRQREPLASEGYRLEIVPGGGQR